jgi:hypothetical protein
LYSQGTDSKRVLPVPTHSVGDTTHSFDYNHGIGQCPGRDTTVKIGPSKHTRRKDTCSMHC